MTEVSKPAPQPPSRGCLAWAGAALLGLIIAGIVMLAFNRTRYPRLERADLDAARQRWSQLAPQNYDIEIEVVGRQPATYAVQVRQGTVEAAMRNGLPLKQRRTFQTWSVPGMFDTIGRDVENLELVRSGRATPQTPRLTLRGSFHPTYGYPLRYLRIESTGVGDNPEVVWEVKKFELVEPDELPPTPAPPAASAPSQTSGESSES